jgi:predicted RNA binding protein YcfA (HicA-like mRNA interferase family)
MKSGDLMKRLKKAGWKVIRIRGSHHQMVHSDCNYVITVPHPKKELGKGLVHAILKQAGLKE